MAKTADVLREAVLALPSHDRARIASELLASLDSETVEETEIDERKLPANGFPQAIRHRTLAEGPLNWSFTWWRPEPRIDCNAETRAET